MTATPPATTPDTPDAAGAGSTGTAPTGAPVPQSEAPQTPIGRIPVLDVSPLVDNGLRPAKAVVDEQFTVRATVFREGHDAVNATVVLVAPDGT
ncbi:maltotransferase domain-containing protein, partial [Pedococcus sp.]|uniref:maltotransferase domain-containing protein n=1 Tax=Pedococcus sp. TaxID=2860345 RepID=UPI002E132A16|nr:maltotransferase domain-containing protein [Pedococcus sp.]